MNQKLEVGMLLRIIRMVCVICLFAPPCVAFSMASAQAQTASSTQPAGKAAKKKTAKKTAKKTVHDSSRSQPGPPNASSESSYGGVPPKHDARQGY